MQRRERNLGLLYSAPLTIFLFLAFLAPICLVAAFSAMPEKVFSLTQMPDFSAYRTVLEQGYWKSVAWSLFMAFVATLILLVICWPLAFGMAKVFKRFTLVLTIGVVI
jgi:spermidine/putrescine transport system permease protein